MNSQELSQIAQIIKKEQREIGEIDKIVRQMEDRVVEKRPSHFSRKDVINAFLGSLTIGLTFILKGATVVTAQNVTLFHIEAIIITTLLILMAEIYFVGYARVKDKKHRHWGQFLTKRLFSLYLIAIVTSFFLIYIFNLNTQMGSFSEIMKLVVVLSMPCSIGAAIPSILKKY